MLLTVVYDSKNGKLIPFAFEPNGEVVILSSGIYNLDDLRVNRVNASLIDLYNGYILKDGSSGDYYAQS